MSITELFPGRGRNNQLNPNNKRKSIPDGVAVRCDSCGNILFNQEFRRNHKVCPKCGFHHRMTPQERLDLLADEDSFEEFDANLISSDPLEFRAKKTYTESLEEAKRKTGLREGVVTGKVCLNQKQVILAVMDFHFVGGSMGSVIGEKITRAFERASEERIPMLVVVSSGGARMQEGMISLMQMAKTSAAVARFQQANMPFISLLTHPTMGGVCASFATLADVIIAEPQALVGFAGPRVIEKTIKRKLPPGFQTAEFLLEHGMIDLILPRKEQKEVLSQLLDFFGR